MTTINTADWKIEPGTLDDWNNKRKSKFEIAPTGGEVAGTHFDGPRVALSKAGKVVAMECECLNTFSLISPEAQKD